MINLAFDFKCRIELLTIDALFLTISVAPNDVIWKHELHIQYDFKNRLESEYVSMSISFNGSGGLSTAGNCTFPDKQQFYILSGSFFNLRALQCGNSLSIAPITYFK